MRKHDYLRSSCFLLLLSLLAGSITLLYYSGWRINTTASMPIGIWKLTPAKTYHTGQIVVICPPDTPVFKLAKARYYLTRGLCPGGYEPLIKPIVAVAGDTVSITAEGMMVNQQLIPHSRPLAHDAQNRPLPQLRQGTYPVLPGTVWIIATGNPGSFDGRYFGALPISQIQGGAQPLWVKESQKFEAVETIH